MREHLSRILACVLVTSLTAPPGLWAGPPLGEAALPVPVPPPAAEAAQVAPPDLPPGTPRDWWSQIQADIARSEYWVTWQEKTLLPGGRAAYQAPNRAQNLRTYFTPEGVTWVPRMAEAPWQVGLTLTSVGAGDRGAPAAGAKLEASGNRVWYWRGGVTEWYVNDARGVEQGFTVASRPFVAETSEPLRLTLSVSGNTTPRLSEDGRSVEFLAPGGALAMRYAELTVVDARGRQLVSQMELSQCPGAGACAVHLVVEDEGAAYPLTIDPLATSPSWSAESDQVDAEFGYSVGTAGDVDGDGYADVIVGAAGYDNGQANEGRAYVYHGSAAGLSASPSWTAESNQGNAQFGGSVATAGDVNGDGYADVIVGAPSAGGAYLYLGSATGLQTTASWTATHGGSFGRSVGTAGDVDRDGYADVVVGADTAGGGAGRAYVYLGSASGLSATESWTAEGERWDSEFGRSVGTAGDVNRDGYADVIVGAPGDNYAEGKAYVYYGSALGPSATASWTAQEDWGSSRFGDSVGTAGDVNGDGYSDIIVGAPRYQATAGPGSGMVYVYHGSTSGLPRDYNWQRAGRQADARFGDSVGTAGDVNGDGYADVVIGESRFDIGEPNSNEGRAHLYPGSSSGLSWGDAEWMAIGDQAGAYFGYSVGAAGDVNGDGYADVIVGAPYYDNGQVGEGRASVFHGSAAGLMAAAVWTAESGQADAYFGGSVATAGDVNGDGYADVIIGAPDYDNGQTDQGRAFVYHGSDAGLPATPDWTAEGTLAYASFGLSVGAAGDVNGDGYADVIVGAPYDSNGQASEGRAFVYQGSATGLSSTASWTAEIDQAYAYFGWRVAGAGDVNGDGFADVIVGAVSYDGGETNEGRALVYHGSAGGLSATPSWSREGDQEQAYFGFSVAAAGDVNGDGYADVIVGASQYDNGQSAEGRAYVYHGSAEGLSLTPNWTVEGNQAGARLGSAVATAGDVNGDGYADVVVGAPYFSNGQTDEGRAYAYRGSATGLSPAPNWMGETDQAGGRFGSSVGTAGDVNGDGYADVLVGAPYETNGEIDEGRAYLYQGSALGLALASSWTGEGGQVGASFGRSVGTAGDVNGDGYADVIVGAPNFSAGEANEGRAFLYYGNTPGVLARVRQVRTDNTPIQPWGATWDPGGFRVRMRSSTWFGHGFMKLQVEVCPSARSFGHFTCETSTSSTWLVSRSTLNLALSGLTYGKLYRWRARALYAPYSVTQAGITPAPNPQHGPWRRLSGQALEADVRILDPDLIFADGFETASFAEADEEDPDSGGEQ